MNCKDFIKKRFDILLILITVFLVSGCENKEPLKIGFAGCLTGRLADLGTSGRNAVMLAVQEINEKGGINGRPVELVIKDDMNDSKTAARIDKELIDSNVAAIIGHTTSSMSIAALPIIQENKIVMISPTSTTNELSGKDDFFFRVTSPDRVQSDILAEYAYKDLGLRQIACIYDLSNKGFTEGWQKNFQAAFEKLGGKVIQIQTFTAHKDISYTFLSHELIKNSPDGVLIIAGALNTAMICQQIRIITPGTSIISSGWAGTSELIQYGGSAVEGIVFPQVFNKKSNNPKYLEFKNKFIKQFGREPNFASVCSYEAAHYLIKALSAEPDIKNLKQQILKQGKFQGLQGYIELDQFGDAKRSQFLVTIRNGEFSILERK